MEQNDFDRLREAIYATLHGDTDAYSFIVTKFSQKLYHAALFLCGNAVAEDMVQETLIDGYLHLSQLREPEKIEGWLMRILRNKALNYITRSRKTESDDVLINMSDGRTPESLYVNVETMREWRKKLNTLSPALRETAVLYFWHGMTMQQIAQRTATPIGTVKRRIHDAREKLKKENLMSNEKMNLTDGFAQALSVKIKELASYTKTYGYTGFDSAYNNIKELIANLSDKEDVRRYSVESARIAAKANMEKYSEEALDIYRKFDNVQKASWHYLDLCWKKSEPKERLTYTKETILPALAAFPDSAIKDHEIAYHNFWLAYYTDKSTPEGIEEAREYLLSARATYEKSPLVDASYANTISALKGIDCLRDTRDMGTIKVTGETWLVNNNNLYYLDQPGCNYTISALVDYMADASYYAGCAGDRYFFPRSIPLEPGAEEDMVIEKKNKSNGKRLVVSTTETVVTPAGTFENCLHIRKSTDNCNYDMWYKDGVGLVKYSSGDSQKANVLSSYEILGGEGWLPLAVGNKWCYETPDKPDVLFERHECVIEQMGAYYSPETLKERGLDEEVTAVSLSYLDYVALESDWREATNDDNLRFFIVSELCDQNKFSEAADRLRSIVIANRNREAVDVALEMLRYLEEKLTYDAQNWRFCPSSVNISAIKVEDDAIIYDDSPYPSLTTGAWGSRNPEDRIFGVKPFLYLTLLLGTLWSKKWVPGYTEEKMGYDDTESSIRLSVDEGGTIETPVGVFHDTIHLTIDYGELDSPDYFFYFYENTTHGRKEYWFARGVGIVRFKCTWGKQLSTDTLLTKAHVVAASDEMMPMHIGNFWQYEEQTLTSENYIARREYHIISGMSGKYLLGDHQMFTWKGSVEEYENWKKTLVK